VEEIERACLWKFSLISITVHTSNPVLLVTNNSQIHKSRNLFTPTTPTGPKPTLCLTITRYMNGGWLVNNPVPADRAKWSAFVQAQQAISMQLHQIVQECDEADSKAAECVSRFWTSAMNEKSIEDAGMTPVQSLLDTVDAVSNFSELSQLIAELNLTGINALFWCNVLADVKDSSNEVMWLFGASLGLGDRDYYLNPNKETQRVSYVKYMDAMFRTSGQSDETAATSAKVWLILCTFIGDSALSTCVNSFTFGVLCQNLE
jgi:putative endopeptidase